MQYLVVWLVIPVVCCAIAFLLARRNIKHIRWLAPLLSLIAALLSIPYWMQNAGFEVNIYSQTGEIIGTFRRGQLAVFAVFFIEFPIQILITFIFACIIYKIIKKRVQK